MISNEFPHSFKIAFVLPISEFIKNLYNTHNSPCMLMKSVDEIINYSIWNKKELYYICNINF